MNETGKDTKPANEAMDVEQAANEDIGMGVNEEAVSLAPGEEDGVADARGTRDVLNDTIANL